jgi:hypothetical protein
MLVCQCNSQALTQSMGFIDSTMKAAAFAYKILGRFSVVVDKSDTQCCLWGFEYPKERSGGRDIRRHVVHHLALSSEFVMFLTNNSGIDKQDGGAGKTRHLSRDLMQVIMMIPQSPSRELECSLSKQQRCLQKLHRMPWTPPSQLQQGPYKNLKLMNSISCPCGFRRLPVGLEMKWPYQQSALSLATSPSNMDLLGGLVQHD